MTVRKYYKYLLNDEVWEIEADEVGEEDHILHLNLYDSKADHDDIDYRDVLEATLLSETHDSVNKIGIVATATISQFADYVNKLRKYLGHVVISVFITDNEYHAPEAIWLELPKHEPLDDHQLALLTYTLTESSAKYTALETHDIFEDIFEGYSTVEKHHYHKAIEAQIHEHIEKRGTLRFKYPHINFLVLPNLEINTTFTGE